MLTMICAIPSISRCALPVLLLCTLFRVSDASVRVVDLGTEYPSRPNKYVGLQMRVGVEYGAKLQRIRGDQHLCGSGHWDVTVPDDGQPVALLVKKGVCSYAQKAEFASRNIHPKGVVKVLIIDGDLRINDEGNDGDRIEDEFNGDSEDSYEFPIYNNRNNNRVNDFRRRNADDISVVLLHVSYRTGIELEDVLLNEATDVWRQGGTLVTVDGNVPPLSRAVIIIWTAVCVILSLIAICCVAGIIDHLLESQEPEPEPPRRPRRQRLTFDQVKKIPLGIFDGSKLVYDEEATIDNKPREDSCSHLQEQSSNLFIQPADHLMDACTICLDDFEIGDKLLCLPCKHAFHANCIAKWLIERSATCPLCKIDLYEEEEDDEVGDEDAIEPQQPQNTTENPTTTESSREPWWRNIFRSSENHDLVSETLTEPLLQDEEQQHPENARPEVTNVQETPISEESYVVPTSRDEETADGSNSTQI